MWAVIATWRMAAEGISEAAAMLKAGKPGGEAIVKAVTMVEDYPYYKSVGYGGLPNENGIVELDAAYMDGDTLAVGAVAAVRDIKNPVLVAKLLSENEVNSFLVGEGAEEFAVRHGFERKTMLTERAVQHYNKRRRELEKERGLKAYDGHDTVAVVCLDLKGRMFAATSTSGLFMKKHGRIGDSALSGSGFYVDSEIGGAGATGLGEDLMKGCISYEIVRLMKEGMAPQQACDCAVKELDAQLRRRRKKAGDISVVAMNKEGVWGAATNIDTFSFAVVSQTQKTAVYLCEQSEGGTRYKEAGQEWLDAYERRIKEPIV
jgi:isoaspartyl peptidase/L-asparaginase-like protein (Ntn-hydrolase superfamily)